MCLFCILCLTTGPALPHVQRCEFCPTNKENVLASFDHLHKCEVDKHLKNGLLTHKAGPIADGE